MRITLLIAALLLAGSLSAQLGLTTAYRFNEAPDWAYPNALAESAPLGNSWAVGIDYWIPLGKTRIDLLPEVSFGQSVRTLQLSDLNRFEYRQNAYSLFLNTHFYVFDLQGDCDCPTFSKSGDFFQKGFFLQVSPGVSFFQYAIEELSEDPGLQADESQLAYSIGVGAGIDIGLSDVLTLTPMAGFRYYLPSEWEGLDEVVQKEPDLPFTTESSIRQIWAGLRLGIRFDQR